MTARDKRALTVGGGLLFAAALVNFVLLPGYNAWADASDEVDSHMSHVESLSGELNRMQMMEQQLVDKFGPAIRQQAITAEEARVAFPKAVQEALARQGAGVSSVQLQQYRKLREAPGWGIVSVRVQATCRGDKVPDVLNSFRNGQHVILVERMGLGMQNPGRRDDWRLDLVLSTPVKAEVVKRKRVS